MSKDKTKTVTVRVKSGNPDAQKEAHLYVFDNQGELMESASLKSGKAELKTKAEAIKGKTQIIVGPSIPKEFKGRKLNPLLMKKMGGYQPSIRLDANNIIDIVGIPDFDFHLWNWCLITGGLTKTFNIDGESKVLPVCDARVHICEVDRIRWWWPHIPRPVITDLADRLKDIIIRPEIDFPPIPDPIPDPDPFPGPDPSPIDFNINVNPEFASARLMPKQTPKSLARLSSSLPVEVRNGLLSSSVEVAHSTIFNNFHLLHPYLCLWPWFWPYFYKCDEIATVYTDCEGKFNHHYFNITGDKDIYIWVEVNIDGEWKTVYRPPIPCNTRWNYNCGADININITDPRVFPCSCTGEGRGEIVWFRSIGNSATAQRIEQDTSNTVDIQGTNFKNVGCTNLYDANGISPFADTLRFKLLFGDGFPSTAVTHYRWRKTNTKNAALNTLLFPGTTVVDGLIQKPYWLITQDEDDNYHFETKAVTLGAEGSGQNIGYRIPHWDIYDDPGVPATHKNRSEFSIAWKSQDFWSANIDSNSLADGLWRFNLELLKKNSAGVFQVVKVPKQVFQVSAKNDSGSSVNAPNDYLRLDGAGNAFNLKLNVRIDNQPCVATIQDASILHPDGTVEYSGSCGFLHYTNTNQKVHLSFRASQLRNFARFSFSVIKGNNTSPITPSINQGGYVGSSVGDYALIGNMYHRYVDASQMLGGCPQAAFSERLYLTSLATDGTRRIREYDRSDNLAFALSNS